MRSYQTISDYLRPQWGCRFVSDNDTEVDVDFAADGSEVFDLWRLRGY
ncbi:DUF6896 domain-containing protein [Streptomyces phaeochromogenes]